MNKEEKENRYPKCKRNPKTEPCPYNMGIHDDYEDCCECCDECTRECAMDV